MSGKSKQYHGILQWQFLVSTGLLYSLSAILVIDKYGAASYRFALMLGIMGLLGYLVVLPYFRRLGGCAPSAKSRILSLMFSLAILATPFCVWLSVRDGGKLIAASPSPVSAPRVLTTVEFKLVPYARVQDITNPKDAKFLLESHYKVIKLKPGRYRLRFDCGNKRYAKKITIGKPHRYVLFLDMRSGEYRFKAKGG